MTKVNAGPWETSVRRAGSADMFALSTNNNHPKIPNVMNKFTSSLFAVAFTFAASVSFANTNAVAAEALTSLLIWINRRYKSSGAGVRITRVPGR